MTELKCSVRSCSFQKDDCCCRGNITVEGAHANRNSETSCGSFEEKKNCGCANSTGKPPKMSDVTCEAVNCKFNEGRKCHAKDIQVRMPVPVWKQSVQASVVPKKWNISKF